MLPLFLNWNKPFLHLTVDFLLEKHLKDRKFDLRNVILTLPGKRAIYRLQELLAERVEKEAEAGTMEPDWYPPLFLTPGTLPEQFYEKKRPFADKFTQELAWCEAVKKLDNDNRDLRRKIIPTPELPDELEAKFALGRMFAAIHRELASDCLDCAAVADYCRKHGITDEEERWNALAAIQNRYLEILDAADIWDLQTARLFFIQPPSESKKQIEVERKQKIQQLRQKKKQIYLVGLTDMNQEQKEILRLYDEFITPLVFAPEEQKNKFDGFGCLIPDKWQYPASKIDIDDSQIKFVSGYEQQAEAVLRKIVSFDSRYSAQDIAVGVPDKDAAPVLQQYLEKHGIKSRYAEGTPVKQTPVFRFLNSLYNFIDSLMFSDFAGLIRHIDVQQYLENELLEKGETVPDILTVSDNYHTEHLPLELPADGKFICMTDKDGVHRPEKCSACQLKPVWDTLIRLTGEINELKQKKTLLEWKAIITGILEKLYGELSEQKNNTDDAKRIISRVRTVIRDIFRSFDEIPHSLVPKADAAEALQYLLQLLQNESIPPREEDGAIELIGWLETVMLDVPVIIVTGMNDGNVPSFLTSDVFLPDSMRNKLGLTDNRRRYARDVYNLQAVLHSGRSTENVMLISGRKSKDGSLLPSRLFFAADDKITTERIELFFSEEKETENEQTDETFQEHNNPKYPFIKPQFNKAIKTDSISVTDFRSYLASPYRYFLERQLGLEVLNDNKEEMEAFEFGNLIHNVLEEFGRSAFKDNIDADAVFTFLEDELEKQTKKKYGNNPRAVILIQKETAEERLKVFAKKQAEHRKENWRIITTEFKCGKETGVVLQLPDDGEIPLIGRIDRIDYNDKTGEYLVLDYKTGKEGAKPEETHRKKDGTWIDLQLPLYNYILRNLPEAEKKKFAGLNSGSKISTGYFLLPPKKEDTGIYIINWEDIGLLDESVQKAREVSADIIRGNFADPPETKSPFRDTPLDWITMKGLENK